MLKYTVIAVCIMILLVISSALANVSLIRDVKTLEKDKETMITLVVSNDETSKLDIAELIPVGWGISDWSTIGISKSNVNMENYDNHGYMGSSYNMYHWEIDGANSKGFSITYKLTPKETGDFNVVSILVYPGGFESKDSTITVNAVKENQLTGMIISPGPEENTEIPSETIAPSIITLSNIVNNILSQKFY